MLRAVKEQFEISNLLLEQENPLREFLIDKNIFVNLPTGYGKSLIFQWLPIAADALFERPHGSSVIVVISPLRALMEDQVHQLNDIGIPAIAITDEEDEEFLQQVLNGNFVLVYGFYGTFFAWREQARKSRENPSSDPSQTFLEVGPS